MSTVKNYTARSGNKYDFTNSIKLSKLIGETIIIVRFFTRMGKYGEQASIAFVRDEDEIDNESYDVATTTSAVIVKQLKEIEDDLPVRVKIEERESANGRKYQTFAEPDNEDAIDEEMKSEAAFEKEHADELEIMLEHD